MNKSIKVTAILYPDGQHIWIKDCTAEQIRACNKAWRESLSDEQRAEHEAAQTMGGAVILSMLENDYYAIPATNSPMAMALVTDRQATDREGQKDE